MFAKEAPKFCHILAQNTLNSVRHASQAAPFGQILPQRYFFLPDFIPEGLFFFLDFTSEGPSLCQILLQKVLCLILPQKVLLSDYI